MEAGKDKRIFETAGIIIVWLTVLLQLILAVLNRQVSVPETIIRFFSYFTILTNILVAIAFTALRDVWGNKWKAFFAHPGNFTAVTVYILIVGIIANLVLRGLVKMEGLQRLVDEFLHVVIPLMVLIYWLSYVATKSSAIHWNQMWKWLLYPLIYCIYIMIRGSFSHFYPYPFTNVDKLGYPAVLLNSVYVTLAFLVVSIILIAYVKFRKRRLVT